MGRDLKPVQHRAGPLAETREHTRGEGLELGMPTSVSSSKSRPNLLWNGCGRLHPNPLDAPASRWDSERASRPIRTTTSTSPLRQLDRQAQLRPLPVGTRGALLEDHRAPRPSQHVGRRSGGLLVGGHTVDRRPSLSQDRNTPTALIYLASSPHEVAFYRHRWRTTLRALFLEKSAV